MRQIRQHEMARAILVVDTTLLHLVSTRHLFYTPPERGTSFARPSRITSRQAFEETLLEGGGTATYPVLGLSSVRTSLTEVRVL
jgi:hypothetical protein